MPIVPLLCRSEKNKKQTSGFLPLYCSSLKYNQKYSYIFLTVVTEVITSIIQTHCFHLEHWIISLCGILFSFFSVISICDFFLIHHYISIKHNVKQTSAEAFGTLDRHKQFISCWSLTLTEVERYDWQHAFQHVTVQRNSNSASGLKPCFDTVHNHKRLAAALTLTLSFSSVTMSDGLSGEQCPLTTGAMRGEKTLGDRKENTPDWSRKEVNTPCPLTAQQSMPLMNHSNNESISQGTLNVLLLLLLAYTLYTIDNCGLWLIHFKYMKCRKL